MAKCSVCGQKAGLMMNMCDACIGNEKERIQTALVAPEERKPDNTNYAGLIMGLGLMALAFGLFNLLNPSMSVESDSILGKALPIANQHKLFMGQTFSILGGMFTLAGAKGLKLF